MRHNIYQWETKARPSNHYLYNTYRGMIDRCYKPSNTCYRRYGGRGIKVCDRWLDSFWNFVEDMGERPDHHTLDRIDNNGSYEPSNCKWSTSEEQNNNRSNNHRLTVNGITLTKQQWSNLTGTCAMLIYSRKKRGWTDEEAIYGREVSKQKDRLHH